jgi:hypothetical protein
MFPSIAFLGRGMTIAAWDRTVGASRSSAHERNSMAICVERAAGCLARGAELLPMRPPVWRKVIVGIGGAWGHR